MYTVLASFYTEFLITYLWYIQSALNPLIWVYIYTRQTTCIHVTTIEYYMYTIVINGQECTDVLTVGSLSHDNTIVPVGQTYILAGYIVPCNRTVVAWEFCYWIGAATSVTFYPGIWRITGTSGINNDYELIQSNSITYNSIGSISNIYPCQRVNLSETDQFTAPAGSVVGLYSDIQTQLLHTIVRSRWDFGKWSRLRSKLSKHM